jgi:hypothetical protein
MANWASLTRFAASFRWSEVISAGFGLQLTRANTAKAKTDNGFRLNMPHKHAGVSARRQSPQEAEATPCPT